MTGVVILACEMIEDEVKLALESIAPEERPPLVWMESGLHDHPEQLQAALQKMIDLLDEGARANCAVTVPSVRPGLGPASERQEQVVVDPVLEVRLAFGFCGKGLQGLVSRHMTLVFPRVDDCVSLLLNDGCSREAIPRNTRDYYQTAGWFRHGDSLTKSFEDWAKRHGAERAAQLRKMMFAGYERVVLIDTKAYDIADWVGESRDFAAELELEHVIVPGHIQLLEKLFRGERNSEIVVIPPGNAIDIGYLFGSKDSDGGSPPQRRDCEPDS